MMPILYYSVIKTSFFSTTYPEAGKANIWLDLWFLKSAIERVEETASSMSMYED